jgi:lipoprotein-anchoring transpeptidase ErfK/SrfK
MKKFLLIVVIIAVAIAAYLYYKKPAKPESKPEEKPVAATTQQTNTEEPKTDGVGLFKEGKFEEAIKQLEKEIKNKPASEQASLYEYLAQAYDKTGNFAKAGELYLQCNNLPEMERQTKARHSFTIALKGDLTKEKRDAIKKSLVLINRNLIFSPSANQPESISYEIKKGDSIFSISNKYNVPSGSDSEGSSYLGQIRRINNMKTSNIRAGDNLKVITGKFSIEVDKSDFTLTLYLNNEFVKEYPIAYGNPKESPTPEGTFKIVGTSKLVNPPWYKYDKATGTTTTVPFGDPQHVIGTRWMTFKESDRIGIHGTSDRTSIGKAVTNGCVRMHNEDVEELFDLVPGGTEVTVKN